MSLMTQQQMLDNQWQEDSSLFGFSDSDWYKDAKDMLSFGWMLNNADRLQYANQQQNDLMYSAPITTRPNAQYLDPRASQVAGFEIKPMHIVGGVVAIGVLAYLDKGA